MFHDILSDIGLTDGEIAVYLALLDHGSLTVTPLASTSKISASKVYSVAERLMDKGLVTVANIEGVKHFSATDPSRTLEYLNDKMKTLRQQEAELSALLPELSKRHAASKAEVMTETFIGFAGMRTAYNEMLAALEGGGTDYVIGASVAEQAEQAKRFYQLIMRETHKRRIKVRVVAQESTRAHFSDFDGPKAHVSARYIEDAGKSEINIYNETTLIVIHSSQPIVVKIISEEVAMSYKQYFEHLWKSATS